MCVDTIHVSMSPGRFRSFSVDSVDSLPNGSTNMSPLNQPSLNWFQTPQPRHTTTAIFVSHPRGLLLGNCPLRGLSSVELERVRCSDVPHESSNFFFGAPKVVPWNTGHCQPHRLFQKMSDLKLALDLATEAPPARKGTWYS